MVSFVKLIRDAWKAKGRKWPNTWEALAFATTELGEVYELLLAKQGSWVRNHPENKETFTYTRLEEELADVIVMVEIAGIASGVDPISRAEEKLREDAKI